MSRAVVLSGGGPVGIAWETGLIVGLEAGGARLADADLVVGTSAGSVVGANLALGRDMCDEVDRHRTRAPARARAAAGADARGDGGWAAMAPRMQALMEAMAEASAHQGPAEEARARLGRFALESQTIPEDDFLRLFSELEGEDFPDRYTCTAVDAETGDFVTWQRGSGVDLQRAVASSCAVPGVYPPVTIDGRRYIDGGMRSAWNADVATGCGRVLAISVLALSLPDGLSDPRFERLRQQRELELDVLRSARADVEVVGPSEELLSISGMGMLLMDPSRAEAAVQAGLRQGKQEADRLRSFWS